MDANAIVQAIGSVGFPIVAAIGMFYLYDRTIKELTQTITKIDTTLQNLVNHLSQIEKEVSPQ